METIKRRIHPQRERKGVTNHAMVSPHIAAEFLRFMEYHPAERFKKNIRKMLFEFLMSEGGVENLYLQDLLYDLEGLFELLDVIEVADRQKKE